MASYRVSATAITEVAHLLQKTILEHPPHTSRLALPPGPTIAAHPLGAYMLTYGYIRPPQLLAALVQQRAAASQAAQPALGDILIQRYGLHPQVLVTLLLVQMIDRLLDPGWQSPLRLGEYLVASGLMTPARLAPALQLQTWLRQSNHHVHLGEILVQQNLINRQSLNEVLHDQQRIWQPDLKNGGLLTRSASKD